jgi:hypothetical protein
MPRICKLLKPFKGIPATYHGRHYDGRFRLKVEGAKMMLTGSVYALVETKGPKQEPLYMRQLLDITPGYVVSKNDEQSFEVTNFDTGHRMFVMGQLAPFQSIKKS